MAAEVEVQTGEVGRTKVGGRLHLSPLADSSNSLISQSHLFTPEPNKPVPSPRPRLTPKPFAPWLQAAATVHSETTTASC